MSLSNLCDKYLHGSQTLTLPEGKCDEMRLNLNMFLDMSGHLISFFCSSCIKSCSDFKKQSVAERLKSDALNREKFL